MPVLPDVLDHGLRIVFCGSAAGRVSAERGAYYAGPGNRFWAILAATGLTPSLLPPEAFPRLTDYRLGLTDIAKEASGADHQLPPGSDDPAALRAKILRFTPQVLAFVGKRPAQAFLGRAADYGLQAESLGPTKLFVLPSPSGAARRHWDDSWWHALARLVA
ncbi:MAG: mismatch-specific DNA-glycosylase [Kiloniellales bacterium]|nr:mismatch-specific DNA-glycosylase [Kiloniellales bacterium]